MAPKAFQFSRGNVFRVKFHPPDQPSETIEKYVVNLQEGKIIKNSPTFVGFILTTQRLEDIYPTDVLVAEQECGRPGGAKILCNQPHTIPKKDIISFEYKLSDVTIEAVAEKSLLGVGIVKIEELESLEETYEEELP